MTAVRLTDGEYIVSAAAVARYRSLFDFPPPNDGLNPASA